LDKPAGIPPSFEDYAKIMIDLQVLAYQTDLTRIITFVMHREGPYGDWGYPDIGIPEFKHTLSHHGNNPATIEKLQQVNVYHMKLFAYFLQKMKTTRDGDGNLLDHSILLYGGGMSNANVHTHINLPMLVLGGGGGKLKGGTHNRYPEGTPMSN